MSLLQAGFGSSGGDYTIDDSLRFRASATAYLSRTPAISGDRRTWTWSGWVKRGALGSAQTLFSADHIVFPNGIVTLQFLSGDTFRAYFNNGVADQSQTTNRVFRDVSGWYHIVVTLNTTEAVTANRVKIYVNGVQESSFQSEANVALNYEYSVNNSGIIHSVGRYEAGLSEYLDSYLTEVNFIDGQALTADDFGEFDDNGTWKPLAYEGTYGTNGFYLNGVGVTDQSGNGNDWTNNNLNLSTSTATTYDQMKDTPSLVDTNAGNFCTLSPISKHASSSTTNANLTGTTTTASDQMILSTFAVSSGKWYWEVVSSAQTASGCMVGIRASYLGFAGSLLSETDGYAYYPNGSKYSGAGGAAYGDSWTNGDVIGIALDLDAGTLAFYKNGSDQGTAFTGISGTYTPGVSNGGVTSSSTFDINFGQRPFAYTPPSGFLKLNTFNLPDSTIEDGSDYFNTVLYTGTGDNLDRSIAAVGFQPDFVWQKRRSGVSTHALYDSVRGSGSGKGLASDLTNSEGTYGDVLYGYISSFDSDGFSTTKGTINNDIFNVSGQTFVAWNWLASNTTVSNTVGSITSTVSVNTTSGFSIVSYTGNATSGATVGHGLGVAPSMYIVKVRSTTESWITYHTSIGATNYLALNLTQASTAATAAWNNTAPTSTVFSLGNAGSTNGSGQTFIAYCFAEVPGYSAIGSYTGNGSADGPFVYTGFTPRWILAKVASSQINAVGWQIYDTARNPNNVIPTELYANSTAAEGDSSAAYINADIVSNGFKLRALNTYGMNQSGAVYIYMAFAENPFKNSNAR